MSSDFVDIDMKEESVINQNNLTQNTRTSPILHKIS